MSIPKIDNKTLKRRYEKIKPVLLDDNGHLRYIIGYKKELPDGKYEKNKFDINVLRNRSFIWNPSLGKVAEGLVKLVDIRTEHDYCYVGFFKPSIAEVLAQIPEEYLDRTVAFETARNIKEILLGANHDAKTTLYTRKQLNIKK